MSAGLSPSMNVSAMGGYDPRCHNCLERKAEFDMVMPHDGMKYPLCRQCKEAFEWGQSREEASFRQLSNGEPVNCYGLSEKILDYLTEKTRLVELYVGLQGSGESGTWYLADMYVPAILPEEQAGKLALKMLESEFDADGKSATFIGVYSIWDDDAMSLFWDDNDDDKDSCDES